jgi:peptidoglycan/LPS O-acetylase OafA/YrhL
MSGSVRSSADSAFIRPLTGVRFIAALWVLLYHYRWYLANGGALPAALNDLLSFGAAGVQLFWVLSCFVITYTYMETLGSRPSASGAFRFWWLRLARVWPVHIVTMLVAGAVVLYNRGSVPWYEFPRTSTTPSAIARNVFLMNDWPFWVPGTSWNLVSWTVSLEWFAYLAFPVLALVLLVAHRRVTTWALVPLAVLPILSFVVYCWRTHPVVHPPWVFTSELAVDFVTGSVLYMIFARIRHAAVLRRTAVRWALAFIPPALIVLACLALAHLVPGANVNTTAEVPYWIRSFVTPLFVVWVLALALQSPGRRGFLSSRALVLGGFISYSLYMVQFGWLAVWGIVTRRFPPQSHHEGLFWTLGLIGGAIVVAFLMWRFVEEPARELMRRLVGARPKPAGEEVAEFWRHDGPAGETTAEPAPSLTSPR